MLHYIVYASTSKELYDEVQLSALLSKSRNNNSRLDITGMLLYMEGTFVQVLEGTEESLQSTFSKICRDSRHHSIITLLKGELKERNFSDWSMGFRAFNKEAVFHIPGYKNMKEEKLLEDKINTSPHPAMIMLRSFYQNNQRYL